MKTELSLSAALAGGVPALPSEAEGCDRPEYQRIPDICRRFGLSRSGVYRLAAQGHIRLVKLAGRTVVDVAAVRRYMAALPAAAIRAPREMSP